MKMIPFEYIVLRILRRYLVPDRLLHRFGHCIPYYIPNAGLRTPEMIADKYLDCAARFHFSFSGKRVVELGPGTTNSAAYELAARGCQLVYTCEPHAPFNRTLDTALLDRIGRKHAVPPDTLRRNTVRVRNIDMVPDHSIDAAVSHSVLEHVADPLPLLLTLHKKLTDNGIMIHIVDYRDHFFKYPYHLLLFSKKTWRKWLDPGDLPGWRFYDHVQMLNDAGFEVMHTDTERDPAEFEKVRNYVSHDYHIDDPTLDITACTFFIRSIACD